MKLRRQETKERKKICRHETDYIRNYGEGDRRRKANARSLKP